MDLRTTYLGLELAHPVMPGASPLVDDLGTVRALEDAGAPAIVMHSLFEEQIEGEGAATLAYYAATTDFFAEAQSFMPPPPIDFALGPDQYLEQIRRIKEAVRIPVIASLNGTTAQGWLDYARLIEQAGADALELNVYHVAADPEESGAEVEARLFEILGTVRAAVRLPIAVKLSPFFSSIAHVGAECATRGANGLVLFNRFYQPDIDPEKLEVVPRLQLSDPSELLLRLRWLAILAGRVDCSLAASGGAHEAIDVVRAVMAGAHAVQMVSALLRGGPAKLGQVRADLVRWMEEHEYSSLAQMRGSMSLARCPDPAAFERANYMRILSSW